MSNTFSTVNPYTETPLQSYTFQSADEVDQVLEQATKAYKSWRATPVEVRKQYISEIVRQLRAQRTSLATLITNEMGKPLRESLAEIDKCVLLCDYYLEQVDKFLTPVGEDFTDKQVTHTRTPTGVVFGIMPWNYPMWQVFRYAVPNLIAGNVVLLKHAPNTTGCALALQTLFAVPAFQHHVFQTLVIDVDLAERVIAHPAVQGVCLTGSIAAGKAVAALAGKHLKKVVLELGSADAFIVLPDAPIDKALDANFTSRMYNAGQACIAAKRTFVPHKQLDYAIAYYEQKLQAIRQGNPLEDATTMGPLAKKNFVTTLHNQVTAAVHHGGKRITGATAEGVFFKPGLLVTQASNPVNQEELFGPVINLIAYHNEQQLLEEVNNTPFGLAAAVWSQDQEHAWHIAQQIEAGTVVINDYMKSDPRIPFGGIKNSGFGKELGESGLTSFLNEKPIITIK